MDITIAKITPTNAERYLNANKPNRKMRACVAEKYPSDERDGDDLHCPVPISFTTAGDVAPGPPPPSAPPWSPPPAPIRHPSPPGRPSH